MPQIFPTKTTIQESRIERRSSCVYLHEKLYFPHIRPTSSLAIPSTALNKTLKTYQQLLLLIIFSAFFLISTHAQAQRVELDVPSYVVEQFGTPPSVPVGPLSDALKQAMNSAFIDSFAAPGWDATQQQAMDDIAASRDPRLVWVISDLMRFARHSQVIGSLNSAAGQLLGLNLQHDNNWGTVTDHLIAWDIPAPPDYLTYKRQIFTSMISGWDRLFVPGDIDWRHLSWGGVMIDDRPYNTTDVSCNCIPAIDNPEVIDAHAATWLKDQDVVFGIHINGASRAYPRRIMEVREMVNDTLGGRQLGIPYCTLCGAAQAYYTDAVPTDIARPILRTSGLLTRSNKVMYDINTYSIFDTFLGKALTGPLAQRGIELPQASVVTTTWGDWKRAHPDTTVLTEAQALGRDFNFRENRDANGPIFPIGNVDPRLPVHEDIIGVMSPSGQPVAFQRTQAFLALNAGDSVDVDGIHLVLDGGGIKATDRTGHDLGSHEAFWFAWSQFHPSTKLWPY